MAREHKLSPTDNNLAVLYQHLLLAVGIYDRIRTLPPPNQNLIDLKNCITWLLREITQAIETSPNWVRGRTQVGDLVELEQELRAFQGALFNRRTPEFSLTVFRDRHQVFYAILMQLLRLFKE